MRLLGLDLSTKSGWCIISPGKLEACGNIIEKVIGDNESENYPINYIKMAEKIAEHIKLIILKCSTYNVVIEETNKGRNRFSQKQLEFIHFAVNKNLHESYGIIPKYVSTSEWRKLVKLDYDDSHKDHNKEFNNQKSENRESIKQEVQNIFNPYLEEDLLDCQGKRAANKIKKAYRDAINDVVNERSGKFRARSEEGRMITKINKKHLSVEKVNQLFNTSFKTRDNDICDSILLCLGYYEIIGVSHNGGWGVEFSKDFEDWRSNNGKQSKVGCSLYSGKIW